MPEKCERRMEPDGWWIFDRCESLWSGELAKTDWRPSECPSYSFPSQERQSP
jgi:hypothetical protein